MKHHLYSFIFLLLDTIHVLQCVFFYSFLLVDPHFIGLKWV